MNLPWEICEEMVFGVGDLIEVNKDSPEIGLSKGEVYKIFLIVLDPQGDFLVVTDNSNFFVVKDLEDFDVVVPPNEMSQK